MWHTAYPWQKLGHTTQDTQVPTPEWAWKIKRKFEKALNKKLTKLDNFQKKKWLENNKVNFTEQNAFPLKL